jgi:hypothetical protein
LVLKDTFLSVDRFWFLGPIYLFFKVVVLLFFMIWIRATWPRIRYDRLMSFGWKVLLPLSWRLPSLLPWVFCLRRNWATRCSSGAFRSCPLLCLVAVAFINRDLRRKSHGRI